jgi:hypothetical protein
VNAYAVVDGLTPTAAAAATAKVAFATASTTAATESTATTAAATEIAAGTFLARTGFVDGECAAINVLAIEIGNGFVGFFLRAHLHERKPAGLAREFIHDEFATDDIARLFEQVEDLALRRVEREVAYE